MIEKILSFLSEGDQLEVAVIRSQRTMPLKVAFRPLRELLEKDHELGGARLGYCYSCERCHSVVTGYSDCQLNGGTCSIPCTIG